MAIDPKGRTKPGYDRHMFICGHERPPNSSRPSCKNRGSLELLPRIKQLARERRTFFDPSSKVRMPRFL